MGQYNISVVGFGTKDSSKVRGDGENRTGQKQDCWRTEPASQPGTASWRQTRLIVPSQVNRECFRGSGESACTWLKVFDSLSNADEELRCHGTLS